MGNVRRVSLAFSLTRAGFRFMRPEPRKHRAASGAVQERQERIAVYDRAEYLGECQGHEVRFKVAAVEAQRPDAQGLAAQAAQLFGYEVDERQVRAEHFEGGTEFRVEPDDQIGS